MNIKSNIRPLVQPLRKIPFIGQLLRMLFATWRAPQTRVSLHEMRVAFNQIERGYLATSEGYGIALRGLENGVRGHELSIRENSEKIAALLTDIENIKTSIEKIHKEMMFELKKPLNNASNSAQIQINSTQSRIINFKKLNNSQSRKLNLGCGQCIKDNFINIDYRELPDVDLIADLSSLPFEKKSVNTIYSAHLITHFPENTLKKFVLPHWYDLLVSGGELTLIAPDSLAMINSYVKGKCSFKNLQEFIFSHKANEGDLNLTMFTPDSAVKLLKEVGFIDVVIKDSGRKKGTFYEFEVIAKR